MAILSSRTVLPAAMLLTAAMGIPASSAAQDGDSAVPGHAPESETITVIGEAPIRERETAKAYVEALDFAYNNRQAARWTSPICPDVAGVDEEIGARVDKVIRWVAEGVGAPVAGRGCAPNLFVTFTMDARLHMADIRRRVPRSFDEVPGHRRDALFTQEKPVRWWYRTMIQGNGGKLVGEQQWLWQYTNSNISSMAERGIVSANVVVDGRLATGRTFDEVALYAALVSLAEIWPEADDLADLDPSILGLFAQDRPPANGLALVDRLFLCEVYRMPLDRDGRYQKQRIVRALQGETECPGS